MLLSSLALRAKEGTFGLPLSAGVFGYEPNVASFFGIPRAIEEGWASMDLHRVRRTYSIPNSNSVERVSLGFTLGSISSALENAIPEQIFRDEEFNPAEGVSAETALGDALANGQRLYSVTEDNVNRATLTLKTMMMLLGYTDIGKR